MGLLDQNKVVGGLMDGLDDSNITHYILKIWHPVRRLVKKGRGGDVGGRVERCILRSGRWCIS